MIPVFFFCSCMDGITTLFTRKAGKKCTGGAAETLRIMVGASRG
jgi:hypothetical protein